MYNIWGEEEINEENSFFLNTPCTVFMCSIYYPVFFFLVFFWTSGEWVALAFEMPRRHCALMVDLTCLTLQRTASWPTMAVFPPHLFYFIPFYVYIYIYILPHLFSEDISFTFFFFWFFEFSPKRSNMRSWTRKCLHTCHVKVYFKRHLIKFWWSY